MNQRKDVKGEMGRKWIKKNEEQVIKKSLKRNSVRDEGRRGGKRHLRRKKCSEVLDRWLWS